MLSQKHAEAKKVNYKSGFFITTNELPDFGHQIDQEAICRRLKVFQTKTLPKKDTTVTSKLKDSLGLDYGFVRYMAQNIITVDYTNLN